MKDKPMVKGTNRKWYKEVIANCQRDSSTTPSEIICVLVKNNYYF
jgi:hypothetical protein